MIWVMTRYFFSTFKLYVKFKILMISISMTGGLGKSLKRDDVQKSVPGISHFSSHVAHVSYCHHLFGVVTFRNEGKRAILIQVVLFRDKYVIVIKFQSCIMLEWCVHNCPQLFKVRFRRIKLRPTRHFTFLGRFFSLSVWISKKLYRGSTPHNEVWDVFQGFT